MIIPLLVLYSISIVYIFMYVGKKALLSHRRWTLLKNVDWTCEHSDFVTRYLHISPIPFILATIIALSFILYGFINNTE
jgi:hypothetical protein